MNFSPWSHVKQDSGNVGCAVDRDATDGRNDVILLDASPRSWRVNDDVPSHDSLRSIHPSDTVVWENKTGTLLEIQDSKNYGR
jgi:hypothetical protein